MKTYKKVSVFAVLAACVLVACALFLSATVAKADEPVEIPQPTFVTKVVVGPNVASDAWKAQVIASMRSGSYPIAEATAPTHPEFLASDRLDAHHLIASSAVSPSWKGVFPPAVGFEGSTGTALWLWVQIKGSSLTLSSVVGNTLSSDGLLNTLIPLSFATYGGSLGIDASGALIVSGPSTTVVKELYFGIKLRGFVTTDQTNANQTMAYVNGAANYWVTFTIQGQDGAYSYSASRTLNTKTLPSYGSPALVQDSNGSWVVTGNAGTTMIVQTSDDLVTWLDLGAYSPGEFLPLLRNPIEMRRFYRLVYPAPPAQST